MMLTTDQAFMVTGTVLDVSVFPVTMDNVVCSGKEVTLNECTFDKPLYVTSESTSIAHIDCTGTVECTYGTS